MRVAKQRKGISPRWMQPSARRLGKRSGSSIGTVFKDKNNIEKIDLHWFAGVTAIPANAFANSSLKYIIMPSKVTSITTTNSFSGCVNLKKIYFQEGFKSIGYYGLASNRSNVVVYLPTTFTSFSNYWNGYESSRTTVTLIMASETVIANNPKAGGLTHVYVPDNSVDAYKVAWSNISSLIKPVSQYVESV